MSVASELRVAANLSDRWYREIFSSPVGVTVLLAIKPIVWYVLFGSLFEGITALPVFPTDQYRAFILPGIVVLMAIEYISLGGVCIVEDFREGFLHKMWAAPISKLSIITGRVIVMSSMAAVQTVMLLAIAYYDGVTVEAGLSGAVAIVLLAGLFAAAMTAISMTIAYVLKYEFAFSSVTSFLVLPVLFVSNAFVPTTLMPDWLATIADANPLTITITGLRTLTIEGWVMDDIWPTLALLVGLLVVSVAAAALSFRRKVESESLLDSFCSH